MCCSASGAECIFSNTYYSQCIPCSSTTTSSSSSSSSSTSSTSTSTSSTATATPTGNWASAVTKAQAAVAKLTTQDKVNLATGTGWEKGTCVGNIAAISSISFPGLCLEDGPLGIRFADKVSAFPAGVNAAATFNRALIKQRGVAIGEENRAKGVNIVLGPAMNIARVPQAGRNWECFGADPYLSGEAAYQTIQGIQSQGVQANAKHYINNEQEHFRDSSSSNVDDRTQHEVYLAPFLQAVRAGVATVMCSYNQINGSYACGNSKILNGLLKTELGFQGLVMSDWSAQHAVGDANSGLDMTMPGDGLSGSGGNYFGSQLLSAVNNGTIPMSRLNDMATRTLAAWYLVGQDSGYPATNFNAWNSGSGQHIDVQGTHKTLIRQIGAASTVLLKNTNNALPLAKPASIAVIGSHAGPNSAGPNACTDRGCNTGVLAMGWGSGTADYPYLIDPLSAIRTRASQDSTTVTTSTSDTDTNAAKTAATGKDVAIVFITADSGEGYITVEGNAGDRNNLDPWHSGNALVAAVAAANKNTIVVVNTVGQITVEPWITNSNVTAVLWAGLPGQEAGNSLVDVLWGAVNPSGRLPYTIAKSLSDYSAQLVTSGSGIVQIPYSEGLNVDYRNFDAKSIAPRFEFGFGLSYTTFAYSNITVSGKPSSTTGPTGAGSSVAASLHAAAVTVSFTVANNGTRAGTEIPQLYLTFPSSANSPPYVLKGFDAVSINAGASSLVSLSLSQYDLSIWNTAAQRWDIPSGTFTISVGASSRDRRLTASLTI
ncbi:glycoside hydrolase superfamily [Auriculariales sp. MPI-PUGE-AT-0066]|nr:glycoside hydrolase superfamily [Auriculariales sp. MPI-PUGE-AT-0066]